MEDATRQPTKAGELRKRVSRWLDPLPAKILLPGQKAAVSKADLRAVLDVLQCHVQYKTGLVCERGQYETEPLMVHDIASKVGRNRNVVARILEGLDYLGATSPVTRGGWRRGEVRRLNLDFGSNPVATLRCNGKVEEKVAVATESGADATESGADATESGNAYAGSSEVLKGNGTSGVIEAEARTLGDHPDVPDHSPPPAVSMEVQTRKPSKNGTHRPSKPKLDPNRLPEEPAPKSAFELLMEDQARGRERQVLTALGSFRAGDWVEDVSLFTVIHGRYGAEVVRAAPAILARLVEEGRVWQMDSRYRLAAEEKAG